MKSSREQFEERFPVPTGVHWDKSNQCYVCKFVSPYLALWMGWQASREAIEIELPRAACYAGYDNDYMMIADDVREAITDTGLKVKD